MPTYGTEVEYPTVQTGEEMTTFTQPSRGSHDLRNSVRSDYGGSGGWPDGHIGSDPTAGIELRSDPMAGDELQRWYREAIVELSKYRPHEPSGITHGGRASTIGLHLHFSGDGFTERKARALYEMSSEPWFKLFACSSITEGPVDTYQVFRNNYCGMRYSDTPSNDCVNRAERGNDHWEWRMLEPVTPDHFDLVMQFMDILSSDGVDEARGFAQDLVDDLDPRLTAVKRAEAIGIADQLEEIDEAGPSVDVGRRPAGPGRSREFYHSVYTASDAPYIYTVDIDNDTYYVMDSDNYTPADNPFVTEGVEYQFDSVLDVDSLTEVDDDETYERARSLAEEYRQTGTVPGSGSPTDGVSTSPATDALLDRLADAVNGDN